MNWQRARTADKKEERKNSICKAALKLFKKNSFESVSFNNIAKEAGFAKSNLYRYFNSKEEIFLNIYSDLLSKWSDSCLSKIKKLKRNCSAKTFAKAWVESIVNEKNFLDLNTMLFVSLERNSSYEQLKDFKVLISRKLLEHNFELMRIFPDFNLEKSKYFILTSNSLLSSLWAASLYNKELAKIYKEKDFKVLKPNFQEDLIKSIEILITGLIASKN